MADDSGNGEGELSVVPAELTAAAKAIKNLLTNMSTGFRSLDIDVKQLTENWVGYQGTLFTNGWSDVREGLSDLFDALEEILVKVYVRGGRVREVPFHYQARQTGKSHAKLIKFGWAFSKTLLRMWRLRNSADGSKH